MPPSNAATAAIQCQEGATMKASAHRESVAPHSHAAVDERDRELMRRIEAGDFDTRQQLLTSNLLHVLRSRRSYARNGAGIFDLLKAGERGLVHALEHFEREGEYDFSNYAAACIRQHIERTLSQQRPLTPGLTRQCA
jgi:DNA-directed RNA polymerase sigma subunit (sigma70/sigma32)